MSAGSPECGAECQEALEQLELYLDGELPNTTLEEVKAHLTACYPCTDRASFEEQLRAIVRRDCVESAPPSLLVRIREHLAGVATDG
ncbi:mycothiol system anti-sigma-R factor [Egicoccus sp. AB-alg6-2]|uniref:mycothiol system anti-sigma-R factor n=1 Tax=Egicoccus sp. AB-alg6-2 TaxID=3242692 RepID=UPI00359E2612